MSPALADGFFTTEPPVKYESGLPKRKYLFTYQLCISGKENKFMMLIILSQKTIKFN